MSNIIDKILSNNDLSLVEKQEIINELQKQLKSELDKKLFNVEYQGFKDFLKIYNL